MRVNGYRCDECGREHLVDPALLFQYPGERIPPDWFMVGRGKPEQGKEPFVFCSQECLRRYPFDKKEY